jgi:hypothetical protein
MLSVLEADFARIPELLGLTTVVAEDADFAPEPAPEPDALGPLVRQAEPAVQLGLF